MKTISKIFMLLFVCALSVAFTFKSGHNYTGVYGVSAQNPAQIQLTINADNTFSYQDFSDTKNKIQTSGTWVQKGNKVVLQSRNTSLKFHKVWQFTNNGNRAKSRKGLCFYSLCKVE